MKIWELKSDENSRVLTIDNKKAISKKHPYYTRFDGSSKIDAWDDCYVMNYRKGKYTDFPYFGVGLPVCSESTFNKIGDYIKEQVEILPLKHEEMNFIALNVINIIDCVDKKRSEADILTSTGDFLGYKKVVFTSEKIPVNTLIFKIPDTGFSCTYVTDRFVELIKLHKLKGLKFIEVWNSEVTEEIQKEKHIKYQTVLEAIEQYKGPLCDYEEAMKNVQSGKAAMASGKWKMQLDDKGRFWLGQLGEDAEYHWLMPTFIPPVLLGFNWHEVERSSI